MDSGYVKLYRKVLDNPRVRMKGWLSVWVWLLCNANHKSTRITWQGKTIKLGPGQLTAGRHQIARELGLSPSQIREILACMVNDNQIDIRSSHVCSLVTITNWGQYQCEMTTKMTSGDNQNDNQNDNLFSTATESEAVPQTQQNQDEASNESPATRAQTGSKMTTEMTAKMTLNKNVIQDREIYARAREDAVVLPRGFPVTEEAAKNFIGTIGCPVEFAIATWQKAMSRGGRDAKDVPIRSFGHYLAREWSYELNRISEQKGKANEPKRVEQRVDRSKGTLNEGLASAYAKLKT